MSAAALAGMTPGPRRIVLMSDEAERTQPSMHLLTSAGYSVTRIPSIPELDSWMRVHRADLVLVDLALGAGASAETLLETVSALKTQSEVGGPPVMLIVRVEAQEQFRELFIRARLSNFLAVDPREGIDPIELTVTVDKILKGDLFGIRRYLSPTHQHLSERIARSEDKDALVEAAVRFAQNAGFAPRIAEQIGIVADEHLMNALYNAPIDASGARRFAHLARSVPVQLDPGQHIEFELGSDGRRFALSVTDPFGSLMAERVVDYVARCFQTKQAAVQESQGGAGLGLYYAFSFMPRFVVNLQPRVRTEVIGLAEISRSLKTHHRRGRSFNLFVASSKVARS